MQTNENSNAWKFITLQQTKTNIKPSVESRQEPSLDFSTSLSKKAEF